MMLGPSARALTEPFAALKQLVFSHVLPVPCTHHARTSMWSFRTEGSSQPKTEPAQSQHTIVGLAFAKRPASNFGSVCSTRAGEPFGPRFSLDGPARALQYLVEFDDADNWYLDTTSDNDAWCLGG